MLIYFFTKQNAKTKQVDSLVLFMRCRSTDLYGFTGYLISSSNFMREIKDGSYFFRKLNYIKNFETQASHNPGMRNPGNSIRLHN